MSDPIKEKDEKIEEIAEVVEEVAKEVAEEVESAYGGFVVSYLKLFSKRCLAWLSIYAVGFFNISFGWLMAPLFFTVLREKRAKAKQFNFDVVRSIANTDEKEFIQAIQKFTSLPSWVTFPDMERVEWVNQIVYKLWPYAGQYVKDLCKETIEPSIAEALKAYKINTFKFEKIILGDTPPRFGGIKVYDDTSRHEIILDTDMVYAGDCKFEVAISKLKAGIKDLQIAGRLRIVMKPLVRQIPLVGGVQVFFLNNPDVDFNLIGVADVFDMPGISDILRSIVVEQIAALMVLPNRYPLQLIQDINVVELKCPAPAGVLRVQVIEAQNLMKKDIGVLGTGKSDPYCILRLGAQKFQTKTINNTVNPRWNFCCEALANVIRRQRITIECWDYDYSPMNSLENDDFLGRANLDVQSIWKSGEVDMWVPLSEAKSGRIHIKATWLDLSDVAASLDDQLAEIRLLQATTKNPLHSAVLMVWIDSATKLNPSHKQIPDPFVRVRVGNAVEETSVRQRTNDPVFEEGFTFLVRSPLTQEMQLEVVDHRNGGLQGRVEVDLNTLLQKKALEELATTYSLSGAQGGMAEIKLTITLRVLTKGQPHKGSSDSTQGTPVKSSKPASKPRSDSTASTSSAAAVSVPAPDVAPRGEEEKVVVDSSAPRDTESSYAFVAPPSPPRREKRDSTVSASLEREQVEPVILAQNAPGLAAAACVLSPIMTPEGAETVLRQRHTGGDRGQVNLGRIQLTIKYGPRNNLVIVVHKVENLEEEEDGELPDPYVKVYLLPDRSKDSKRKTDVIKDSCHPVYDERMEYAIAPNELTQRTLEVSVVNKKGFFHMQKSNIMGQVHIDCGLLNPQDITNWYDLQPPMDEGED